VYGAVYSETSDTSIDLDNIGTGTEENPISFIGYDGAVFDGGGILDYGFSLTSPLSYLGFYNFNFINYIISAIFVNNEDITNIDIIDNIFSGNGTAIDAVIDSNLNILNNIIEDNDVGINVSADDVNITGNIIRNNGQDIIVDGSKENVVVEDNGPLTVIRVVETDKEDYLYGEQVIITGSGYEPFQEIILKILRPDGTFVDSIYITIDENGNFTYDGYSVDYAGKDYLIEITDIEGSILEVLSFTDDPPPAPVITFIDNVPTPPGYIDSSVNSVPGNEFYGTDNGGLTDPVVWHFILNNLRSGTPPGVITAVFDFGTFVGPDHSNPANTPNMAFKSVAHGKTQHFYVGTPGDCKLLSATFTTVEGPQGTGDPGDPSPSLVLSHVVHNTLPGSIIVTKTGLEGDDQANLSLWYTNGTAVITDDILIQTSPQKVSDNGTATWAGLILGDYYIVEDFNVDNETEGSVTVNKSGLQGTDTATFELYKADGTKVGSTITVDNDTGSATYPASDGWSNLVHGTYYVEELTPTTGYRNIYHWR
jgi:hypothetical protein